MEMINVAAYIRVSSDSKDQENSFENQERYFTNLIENHANWNGVGIYADFGISGTGKQKRTGFKRLIRHCSEGKIDRIICKSISRFARNTLDFMQTLRMLKEYGVTIHFEKENIDTAMPTGDFILTALAAIAQEESRSISGNIRLGNQMRYAKGNVCNKLMYGYRYSEKMIELTDGYVYRDIEINEDEAKIVRRIFNEAANGFSYANIAKRLNLDNIPVMQSSYAKKRKLRSSKG